MRWTRRPEGSNWGEFGPDDQRGRMNLLTPARRRQGIAEAREGIAFTLSLPLDYPGGNVLSPYRHPPCFHYAPRAGQHMFNFPLRCVSEGLTDVVCDDAVLLYTQYSTQWDALSHVGALFDADGDGVPEMVFYNGFRAGEHILSPEQSASPGAKALGVEAMATAGVQGRGVLVDLHQECGWERVVIGHRDLMAIMARQGAEVEEGDFLCLRTGYAELLLEMGRAPDASVLANACAALDGRDPELLEWITRSGLTAICADNFAVEAYPARAAPTSTYPALPLHEHCLFKLGVHLGELWHFRDLAAWLQAQGRRRFLLTAPPLRLPGAVGSPVTPVATV